jgi:PAS domain S-box-containing protein
MDERARSETSPARFRRIVEAAGDGIVTVDGRGVITSANPAMEALFGHPAAELSGHDLVAILPGAADLVGVPVGHAPARRELDGRRSDGTSFPVELSLGVATGEHGPELVAIVRDVSQRRAIEQMKDEFIATVSHELRTPLTALKGHVELVLDEEAGPVTDLQRRFLQIASQNAERLGALINDLLDVARIEAGKVQTRKEPVDLAAVLQEVVATLALQAERRGLVLREEIPSLPIVIGDRDRLVQVFTNLLSNAIKYTPEGEVGIRGKPGYGTVQVEVFDTGVGMTPEEQRQLFKKFFRGRDSQVRSAGGTGLGLVIAQGIVHAHGGTIAVESAPGQGTRCRVTLPAVASGPTSVEAAVTDRPTVLVVDDEVAIRDLLLEYVRLWGYHGIGAADGRAGLDLARRVRPAVAILDVVMASMSGLEVLTALKADPATRDIPVLLHSVTDDPQQGLALGAAEYLQKPVSPSRLRDAIQRALKRRLTAVWVIESDAEWEERMARELGAGAFAVHGARTPAAARALGPAPPAVILLAPALADGPTEWLLRAWQTDPAFRQTVVVLTGSWPEGAEGPSDGDGCRVERSRGRRAADLAAQVRTIIAARDAKARG